MTPATQARLDRELAWKRSWPSCFLKFLAVIETFIGLLIFLTEVGNIVMDFWHTNVFGGVWASIIIFINWMLFCITGCCTKTMTASTCAFIWNLITLLTLGTLIAFDIIFIFNPTTCLLTPKCSSQSPVISLNFIMQLIPPFKNYSSYDSKKFFLQIQVICAGVAFVISSIYVLMYIICRIKLHHRVQDYCAPASAPPPPSHYEIPVAIAPSVPWTTHTPYGPY